MPRKMVLAFSIFLLPSARAEKFIEDNIFENHNHYYERYTHSLGSSNLDTLYYVIVMTRHGSRSPEYTYPNDPYPYTNRTFWPDGPEELTKLGKQQMYVAGLLLRDRYKNFLNEDYRPEDNKLLSNRFNRNFMSVACLLAGLYPPKGYQIWNEDIKWQPIPIWEDPFDTDYLHYEGVCPRFILEAEKVISLINENYFKYRKLLKYLSVHMGREIVLVTDIIYIWSTFYLQQQNGYELSDWMKAVFPELFPLHAEILKATLCGTPKMTRISAGPIMNMINQSLMNKTLGKTHPQERLFVHGGHDSTLQAILYALGYESAFSIEPSALLIFELHKSPYSDFTLQVLYYNNSAQAVPNILDPPNCPKPCTLDKFNELVVDLNPKDWKAECETR